MVRSIIKIIIKLIAMIPKTEVIKYLILAIFLVRSMKYIKNSAPNIIERYPKFRKNSLSLPRSQKK
jgi:hypothetical protein